MWRGHVLTVISPVSVWLRILRLWKSAVKGDCTNLIRLLWVLTVRVRLNSLHFLVHTIQINCSKNRSLVAFNFHTITDRYNWSLQEQLRVCLSPRLCNLSLVMLKLARISRTFVFEKVFLIFMVIWGRVLYDRISPMNFSFYGRSIDEKEISAFSNTFDFVHFVTLPSNFAYNSYQVNTHVFSFWQTTIKHQVNTCWGQKL